MTTKSIITLETPTRQPPRRPAPQQQPLAVYAGLAEVLVYDLERLRRCQAAIEQAGGREALLAELAAKKQAQR